MESAQPTQCIRLIGPPGPDSNSRLLTYLAWCFPSSVSRTQIAEALWPELGEDQVVARLRVGLSRLRRSVRLVEHGDHVALDPNSMTTDVHRVRSAVSKAADEPDPSAELRALASVRAELSQPVLIGEEGPWAHSAQAEWSLEAGSALIRTARLAIELGELDLADSVTVSALTHLGHDEEVWELRLTALSLLGRSEEGLRQFAKALRTVRSEGHDFSDNLLEHAEALRSGSSTAGAYPLGRAEEDLLARFFSRAMESEPEAAMAVLASSSFRPEVFRRPLQARRLLADVLARCLEPSVERERCHVRLIGALAALEEHEEAIQQCEQFLAQDVAPSRRRIALLNMSFSLFTVGHWDRALQAAAEAAEIAEATGWPYDAWQCRCQHAMYRAVLGDPKGAIPTLRQGLAYFAEHPIPGGEQDVAMIQTDLGKCLLLVGEIDEARTVLRASDATARSGGFASVEARSASLLGRVLALAKDRPPAASALIRGLRVAYRTGTRRILAAALADTVYALRTWSSPDAESVRRDWAGVHLATGNRVVPLDEELLDANEDEVRLETDAQVIEAVRRAIMIVREAARS